LYLIPDMKKIVLFFSLAFIPLATFAQATTGGGPTALQKLVFKINAVIINPLIATLFIVAFVIFLFGVVEFLRKATDKDGREVGKRHMLWGIIGFVIMLGVYGIINFLVNTFNLKGPAINQKEQKFESPSLPELKI
jgi:heme/copper-type cytochrome/quinol oxidase subunit 2